MQGLQAVQSMPVELNSTAAMIELENQSIAVTEKQAERLNQPNQSISLDLVTSIKDVVAAQLNNVTQAQDYKEKREQSIQSGCFSFTTRKNTMLLCCDVCNKIIETAALALFYYGPTKSEERAGFALGGSVVVLGVALTAYREILSRREEELKNIADSKNNNRENEVRKFLEFLEALELIKKREESVRKLALAANGDDSSTRELVSHHNFDNSLSQAPAILHTPRSQSRAPHSPPSSTAAVDTPPNVIPDNDASTILLAQKCIESYNDLPPSYKSSVTYSNIVSIAVRSLSRHSLQQELADLETEASQKSPPPQRRVISQISSYGVEDSEEVKLTGEAAAENSAAVDLADYQTSWALFITKLVSEFKLKNLPDFIETRNNERLTRDGFLKPQETPSQKNPDAVIEVDMSLIEV